MSRGKCCLLEVTEERVLLKAQRSCGQASPPNLGNKTRPKEGWYDKVEQAANDLICLLSHRDKLTG